METTWIRLSVGLLAWIDILLNVATAASFSKISRTFQEIHVPFLTQPTMPTTLGTTSIQTPDAWVWKSALILRFAHIIRSHTHIYIYLSLSKPHHPKSGPHIDLSTVPAIHSGPRDSSGRPSAWAPPRSPQEPPRHAVPSKRGAASIHPGACHKGVGPWHSHLVFGIFAFSAGKCWKKWEKNAVRSHALHPLGLFSCFQLEKMKKNTSHGTFELKVHYNEIIGFICCDQFTPHVTLHGLHIFLPG